MIRIACSHIDCGQSYRVPDNVVGRTVTCKSCNRSFIAKASQETKSSAAVETGNSLSNPTTASALTRIGRFQIRERLGSGAFGTVYRAFDGQLERDVAIKVPQAGLLTTPDLVQRFMREAKAAARLTHPYIVPVYDAGRDGDQYYIASEFIDGQPLSEIIEKYHDDYASIAVLIHRLAEGLAYSHSNGIIHRDVKPHNVMIDNRGIPHLMDFGLARVGDDAQKLTHDGTVMGTPAYMSPEQATGSSEDISPASDQYSLAIVLFELLTGVTPFGGSPSVVIYNVINQTPPTPRSINPAIPLDLETICKKAMAKSPAERYANCHELADDLQRWLRQEPIRARPQRSFERLARWCRKEPIVAGLSAAFVLTLIAGVTASTVFGIIARTKAAALSEALEMVTIERDRSKSEKARADEKALLAEQTLERLRTEQQRVKDEQLRADKQAQLAEITAARATTAEQELVSATDREKQATAQQKATLGEKMEVEAEVEAKKRQLLESKYWYTVAQPFPIEISKQSNGKWTTNYKAENDKSKIMSEIQAVPEPARGWEASFYERGSLKVTSLPHALTQNAFAFIGPSNSTARVVAVQKKAIVVYDVSATEKPDKGKKDSLSATRHVSRDLDGAEFPFGTKIRLGNRGTALRISKGGTQRQNSDSVLDLSERNKVNSFAYSGDLILKDAQHIAQAHFDDFSDWNEETGYVTFATVRNDGVPAEPIQIVEIVNFPMWSEERQAILTTATLEKRASKLEYYPHPQGGIRAIRTSRDGKILVTISWYRLLVFESNSGKCIFEGDPDFGRYSLDGSRNFAKLSSSARILIAGFPPNWTKRASVDQGFDYEIHRLDYGIEGNVTYRGSLPITLNGLSKKEEEAGRCFAIAPDDSRVFSGEGDGTVRIWRTDRVDEAIILARFKAAVVDIAMSDDGSCLACATSDGTIAFFSVPQ